MQKRSDIVAFALMAALAVLSVPGSFVAQAQSQRKEGGTGTASGEKGPKAGTEKKGPAPVVDLKLEGTVEKLERKFDDGKVVVLYMLRTAEGMMVRLPFQEEIQYEGFVGARVSVEGKGIETEEQGKKYHNFRKVLKIEKLPEPAPNVPEGSTTDSKAPQSPAQMPETNLDPGSETLR